MSEPMRGGGVDGAIREIISAMSALNMPPQANTEASQDAFYLSERDHWAKHAYEHLVAAVDCLQGECALSSDADPGDAQEDGC